MAKQSFELLNEDQALVHAVQLHQKISLNMDGITGSGPPNAPRDPRFET
jgi:hypothetical protein